MRPEILQEYYPLAIQRIFQHSSTHKRILYLQRGEEIEDSPEFTALEVKWNPKSKERNMFLTFNEDYSLIQITHFLSQTQLDNIDEFRLNINGRRVLEEGAECNIETMDMILKGMQSVKEMSLDLPASFVDIKEVDETQYQHAQLEKLTINATEDIAIQSLLDRFGLAYPRLKGLSIFYNCGVWRKYLREYQLELAVYRLESLAVDITPVFEETKNCFGDEVAEKGFFVVDVESLANSKRYSYQVSFVDFKATEILGDELRGFLRVRDYIRLLVTVQSLQQLKLCRYAFSDENEDYMKYPDEREVYTIELE